MDPPSPPQNFSTNLSSLRQALNQSHHTHISEIDLLSNDSLLKLAPHLHHSQETKASLHLLRDLQKDHDAIFSDYIREKQQLENKYEAQFAPTYQSRRDALAQSNIENFWFVAFENCQVLRENITDKDAVALRYLSDVACQTATSGAPNPPLPIGSFTIRFTFRDNPFFENDVLTKTYIMQDDDFEDLAEARGCRILWKPGKDLTIRTFKKKTRNGRVLVKKQPTDSFFNFFTPPEPDTDMDPELMDELEDVRDADFELGECIRSDLIPRALLYFLNIVEGDDDEDDDDEDDDDGADDENGAVNGLDPDVDDDDDDEDHEKHPVRMEKPVGNTQAPPPPEDCKQQ